MPAAAALQTSAEYCLHPPDSVLAPEQHAVAAARECLNRQWKCASKISLWILQVSSYQYIQISCVLHVLRRYSSAADALAECSSATFTQQLKVWLSHSAA